MTDPPQLQILEIGEGALSLGERIVEEVPQEIVAVDSRTGPRRPSVERIQD